MRAGAPLTRQISRAQDIRIHAAVLVLSLASSAFAQPLGGLVGSTRPPTVETAPASESDMESLHQFAVQQRQHLETRIATIRRSSPSAEVSQVIRWQLEVCKYMELLCVQNDAAQQRHQELLDEEEQLHSELDLLRSAGPTERRPYSFLLLHELQDQLHTETGRVEASSAQVEAAQGLLQSVLQKYQEAEAQRRQTLDAIDRGGDAQKKQSLQAQLETAKLISRASSAAVALRKIELQVAKQKQELARLRQQWLQEKTAAISKDVAFSQEDLATCMSALAGDEGEIRQKISQAQQQLAEIEQRWLAAKARQHQTGLDNEISAEELEARQLEREMHTEAISLLNQRLAEIAIARLAWDRRYRCLNRLASADEQASWLSDLREIRQRHSRSRDLLDIRVRDLRLELSSLDSRLVKARQQAPQKAQWLDLQVQQLQSFISVLAANIVRLDATDRLLERTITDLGGGAERASGQQRLQQVGRILQACWTYEITSVDDRPVTVGKLVLGGLLLLLGYFVARTLSRVVGRRVFTRLGMTAGAATALQTISFYLLLTIIGFLSLEWVNVPLTVFTFLGGAAAIGVGFGSQNLMNNFISGLILLAERPVRIGDLVDIDGVNGTIEFIGARSTRVKTGAHLEVIVPNSMFLENKVTNWTLSDIENRIMVSVGVAYGSPSREVTRLLQRAVVEHPAVLQSPEPVVLFKDFGDNALMFEVHFWVQMKTLMQGERIASEIRHTVDHLFAEANIVIAYPQRDIHLDSIRPLEVNVRQIAATLKQESADRYAA